MENRISKYTLSDPHPLDRPELVDRRQMLQRVCLALIVGSVVVGVGVLMVVKFALGGAPLPGNGARLGGIPVLTVVGAVATLTAVAAAMWLGPQVTKNRLLELATEPIPPPAEGEPAESESERLLQVYSAGKFVEFALAEMASFLAALLYHLSSDWLLLVFAAGMIAFLVVRFPTTARIHSWYGEAAIELETIKAATPEAN